MEEPPPDDRTDRDPRPPRGRRGPGTRAVAVAGLVALAGAAVGLWVWSPWSAEKKPHPAVDLADLPVRPTTTRTVDIRGTRVDQRPVIDVATYRKTLEAGAATRDPCLFFALGRPPFEAADLSGTADAYESFLLVLREADEWIPADLRRPVSTFGRLAADAPRLLRELDADGVEELTKNADLMAAMDAMAEWGDENC